MINDIATNNTLYPDYLYIKINLIKSLPHYDYLEQYITKCMFPWEEHYLEALIDDFKQTIDRSRKGKSFVKINSKTLNQWQSNLILLEKQLKNLEPLSSKASPLNDNAIIISNNVKIKYSHYDNKENILKPTKAEEDYINVIIFDKIRGNFKIIKEEINKFHNEYKNSNYIFSLRDCLAKLSNISKDLQYLERVYQNEPILSHNNLDLNQYKDTLFSEWRKLIGFIDNLSKPINDQITKNRYQPKLEYPKIFKDFSSFELFTLLYQHLDIKVNANKNQAKFSAIWEHNEGQKLFKINVTKKEYVEYINKHFKTNYNSRSMSKGTNFHYHIDEFYNERH